MNPSGPRLMVAWNKMDSVPGACWQVIWHVWRWAINLPLVLLTLSCLVVATRGRQVSWCPDLYRSLDSPPAVCLKLPLWLEATPITSCLAGIIKLWLKDSELWQAVVDSKSSSQIQTSRSRFPFTARSSLESVWQFNGAKMIICQPIFNALSYAVLLLSCVLQNKAI